ncbi:hypothetical protein B9Z55_008543 [Caenorhabditis nigoni]|uniref:Uncharacterized protein n=1 Tax=Caenorhabditis nigoni TaxID=1611254 RepID=A0A2G5UN14_9PELO|nr:hypothetical protein B9Z55_008543 [Caenorhabditis nigoni]
MDYSCSSRTPRDASRHESRSFSKRDGYRFFLQKSDACGWRNSTWMVLEVCGQARIFGLLDMASLNPEHCDYPVYIFKENRFLFRGSNLSLG